MSSSKEHGTKGAFESIVTPGNNVIVYPGPDYGTLVTPLVAARTGIFVETSVEREAREAEWKRQTDRLIELGFHRVVHPELSEAQAEAEYRESLPKIGLQPPNYNGRFDIPVLVDPRVPPPDQLSRAEIREWLSTRTVKNTVEGPDKPYVQWTQVGKRLLNLSPKGAMRMLDKDEVGCTFLEVIALYLQHPKIFENRKVIALSSRLRGAAPYLGKFNDITSVWTALIETRSSWSQENYMPLSRGIIINAIPTAYQKEADQIAHTIVSSS